MRSVYAKKWQVLAIVKIACVSVIILTAIVGLVVLYQSKAPNAHAAPKSLTFSQFATHPYASNTGYDETSTNYYTGQRLCVGAAFCPTGQALKDIEFTEDGKLIAGYGDWNSNVDSFGVAAGRIGIVPLDVTTNTWGTMTFAGSEALDIVRKINGKLYLPTTDPSDKAATGVPSGNRSGYMTNDTPDGSWKLVDNGRGMTHTFDVGTSNGSDLFTVGSFQSKAYAMRSTNNGVTWTESIAEQSAAGNDSSFARYYSISNTNGSAYVRGMHISPRPPLQKFTGSSWNTESVNNTSCVGSSYSPNSVQTYNGLIVCGASDSLKVFDGVTEKTVEYGPRTGYWPKDIYATDDYLYVLTQKGLYRSKTLETGTWEKLALEITIPSDAVSMAVYDDYIYFGADAGKIYRSDTKIESAEEIGNENCFTVNGAGSVTHYENACGRDIVIPSEVRGVAVTAIQSYVFSNRSIASVQLPDSVKEIGADAFSGNNLTTVELPESLERIGAYAFSNNSLTSLDLPNSLTTIGDQAFRNNAIEAVSFSSSLTAIAPYAFANNVLKMISLPVNIESIGSWAFADNELESVTIAGNPTVGGSAFRHNGMPRENVPVGLSSVDKAQYYQQNASFVAVNTANPATIAAYNANTRGWSDNKQYLASSTTNQYVAGATLLNPSQLSVEFVDAEGNELTPSQTKTGQRANGVPLTHRKLASAINATNPLALTVDRTVFYVVGQQATAPAPAIAGFTQPAQRSVTLAADPAQNVLRYVYAAAGQPGGGVTTPQNPSAPGSQPGTGSGQPSQQGVGVPNTGLSSETKGTLIVFAVIATFGLGITIYASYRSGRQERR